MSTLIDISPKKESSSPELENEKSFENEQSLCDLNENLLKHFEGEIFWLQNEVRKKNQEIQMLCEELDKRLPNLDQNPQFESIIREYENEMKELMNKLEEKEQEVVFEKTEKERYRIALEKSEKRIEELTSENRRLNGETHDLVAENTKLHRILQEKEGEQGDECDLSYFSFANLMSARQEKVINVSLIDNEENLSTHESDFAGLMRPNAPHGMRDKVWLTKLELLRGKLLNEERKTKELEYMVSTQRQVMEDTNKVVLSLKSENRSLENKFEELTQAMEELKEVRMREKAKLDHMSSFYEMMQKSHSVKSQEESPQGKTPRFKQEQIPESHYENTENYKGASRKNSAPITQEIKDIKSELNNLAQFLQQSLISSERRTDYSPIPQKRSHFGSLLEPQRAGSTQKPRGSYMYLKKAVANSTSLWCNIKANMGPLNKMMENGNYEEDQK